MGRGVVFVTASLSSVLQELVNVCYLACHLVMVMVSFSVLEDILCVEQFLIDVLRGEISTTDYEDFC